MHRIQRWGQMGRAPLVFSGVIAASAMPHPLLCEPNSGLLLVSLVGPSQSSHNAAWGPAGCLRLKVQMGWGLSPLLQSA